ncbi:MAG: tail fiber protein [bacterium]|nr:tail fiber protein [bacterium]
MNNYDKKNMRKRFIYITFILIFITNVQINGFYLSKDKLLFSDNVGWEPVEEEEENYIQAIGYLELADGRVVDDLIDLEAVREGFDKYFVGIIAPFAIPHNRIPDGWLPCDGSLYTVTSEDDHIYRQLANKLRTSYGGAGIDVDGNWEGTFGVPDLRGVFLMGEGISAEYLQERVTTEASDRDRQPSIMGEHDHELYNEHAHTASVNYHEHLYTFDGTLAIDRDDDFYEDDNDDHGPKPGSGIYDIEESRLSGIPETVDNKTFDYMTIESVIDDGQARVAEESRPENYPVYFYIKY